MLDSHTGHVCWRYTPGEDSLVMGWMIQHVASVYAPMPGPTGLLNEGTDAQFPFHFNSIPKISQMFKDIAITAAREKKMRNPFWKNFHFAFVFPCEFLLEDSCCSCHVNKNRTCSWLFNILYVVTEAGKHDFFFFLWKWYKRRLCWVSRSFILTGF